IMILVPDTGQKAVYDAEIAPNLRPGQLLMFAHGFNIHFGRIDPPGTVDVGMVAPKGPGHLLRSVYQAGGGVPSLFAVHRDNSGTARPRVLAYARALGSTRAGVFETMHELKLIVDLLYRGGLNFMRFSVSDTAEYGDYVSGPRIIDDRVRETMRAVLGEIQDGSFANRWIAENESGRHEFERLRAADRDHQIEKVGAELRAQMAFINPVVVVAGQAQAAAGTAGAGSKS